MLLPLLSGLRVGADAEAEPPAPTPELSADLIGSVLAAVEGGEYEAACRAAARWCALNRAHRDACRDDAAAWRALGARVFAGASTLVEGDARANFYAMCELARNYRLNRESLNRRVAQGHPDDRVKAYVLSWLATLKRHPGTTWWPTTLLRVVGDREVMHMPPGFENDRDVLLAMIQANIRFDNGHGTAEYVLDSMPQYRDDREIVVEVVKKWPEAYRHASERLQRDPAIAKLAVEEDATRVFEFVPTDLPNYGELAKFAVRHWYATGYALQHVPTDRADYGEIAKIAVKEDGKALQHVPSDRADYGILARLAVEEDDYALEYVPSDRDDYGALAKFVLQQQGGSLHLVATDYSDYGALARLAVQQSAYELRHVPTDRDDYGEIAKLAVQTHGESLQFVPADRDDYNELAWLAIERFPIGPWDPDTRTEIHPLRDISPGDVDDYVALARLSVERNPWAVRWAGRLPGMSDDDYVALARFAIGLDWTAMAGVGGYRQVEKEVYIELARFAIQQNVHALKYVNDWVLGNDADSKDELMWFAIEQDVAALGLFYETHDFGDRSWYGHNVLEWPGDEEYYDFAKYAIDQTPHALQFVHTNREDYYALAKYAIKEDVGALKYVATNDDDYYELAKYAIKQSPDALLHYVPKTRPDYNALLEVHEAEWGRFRRRRHPPWDSVDLEDTEEGAEEETSEW